MNRALIQWLSPQTIDAIGWTLIHFVWQGVLIEVLLAALLVAMRKATSNVRCLTACMAMFAMAIVPVGTFLVLTPRHAVPSPTLLDFPQRFSAAGDTNNSAADTIQLPPVAQEHRERASSELVMPAAQSQSFFKRFHAAFPWLVAGWFFGVMVHFARLALGWGRLLVIGRKAIVPPGRWGERLAALSHRLGVRKPIRLLTSVRVNIPCTIGWMKPIILIPAGILVGLAPAQLEAILAHELAHIRRHDYLINLIQTAIEAILFYHPAVWWVSGQIRIEREHCCDDIAAAACRDRLLYVRALATLEELRAPWPRLAAAAGDGDLLSRIRRLMGRSTPSHRTVGSLAAVIALSLAILVTVGIRWMERGGRTSSRLVSQATVSPVAFMTVFPVFPLPAATASLESRIIDAGNGKPIAGITVNVEWFYEGDTPVNARTVTDAAGEYQIRPLAPGHYRLRAFQNTEPEKKTWLDETVQVRVANQPNVRAPDIQLIHGATVSGKVLEQSGEPALPKEIRAYPEGQKRGVTAAISRLDGTYTARLRPGAYTLAIRLPAGANIGGKSAEQKIDLEEGKSYSVDFRLVNEPSLPGQPLKGKVVDPQDQLIAGATVRLEWLDGTPPWATTTDAAGSFISPPIAGMPRLRVFAAARQLSMPGKLDVKPGQDLKIRAQPWSTVRGIVHDNEGRPVVGASIIIEQERVQDGFFGSIWNYVFQPAPTTDSNGRYNANVIFPRVRYQVVVWPGRNDFTFAPYDSGPQQGLEPGTLHEMPEVGLMRANSFLAGRVLDEKGNTVSDASVLLHRSGSRDQSVATDSDGYFHFTRIADGDYAVTATRGSIRRAAQRAKAGTGDTTLTLGAPGPAARQAAPSPQTPAASQPARRGGFTSPPSRIDPVTETASISGRVVFADTGKPAAGFTVVPSYYEDASEPIRRAVTHADGQYEFKSLPPGHYAVRISMSTDQGKAWMSDAAETRVADKQNLRAPDIRVIRGTTLTGKVVDSTSGKPIRATVRATAEGDISQGAIQSTNANGNYTMRLRPGAYRIGIQHVGLAPRWQDPQPAEQKLVVEEGNTYVLDFGAVQQPPAPGAKPVTGKVVDAQGRPIASALVLLTGGGGVRTLADGSFTSTPVVGATLLRAFAVQQQACTPQPMEVSAGQNVVIQLRPWPTISGTVRDPSGKPIAGAILAVPVGLSPRIFSVFTVAAISTDARGKYRAPLPFAGDRYRLIVRGPSGNFDYAEYETDPLDPLKPGENYEAPDIVLPRADSFITGRVVDETGGPSGRVAVTYSSKNSLPRNGRTDPDGYFHLVRVAEGDYDLTASLGEGIHATGHAAAGTSNTFWSLSVPPPPQCRNLISKLLLNIQFL